MKKNIAILGAGSWGTAVAIHLANCGFSTLLWTHRPEHATQMIDHRINEQYLPEVHFPTGLFPTSSLEHCLTHSQEIILAVPSHAFADLLFQINSITKNFSSTFPGLSWLTKGIDPTSHQLLSQLVSNQFGANFPIVIISGPSFAKEVAKGLPTALTLASNNFPYQKTLQSYLHHSSIRAYLSTDIIGVQLCGAVKNILAIACGISDGLGYGANAKAALITRGLTEMTRLGVSMGAQEKTFTGLAGVGDLVLTCTDDQSRNRRFGLQLGRGTSIKEAQKQINQVIEGKENAIQVCSLAQQFQIEMPICFQVKAVLEGKSSPEEAVISLMQRTPGEE